MHGGDNFLNNEQWRTLREILGGGGAKFSGEGGRNMYAFGVGFIFQI